jgi:hypothetical protein
MAAKQRPVVERVEDLDGVSFCPEDRLGVEYSNQRLKGRKGRDHRVFVQ